MINLNQIKVASTNQTIETRNKVYRLALDIDLSINLATRLATLVSELLQDLLKKNKLIPTNLSFKKEKGYYYLTILISCDEFFYKKIKLMNITEEIHLNFKQDKETHLEISTKIKNTSFIPNDEFLQQERERLIQQSNSEMLLEIKRKNIELNKALEDLKTSSRTIQVEKMRALGDMTAGVAHEINNPMMGILNFVQYAIKHTEKEDRKYKPLIDAEREVKRCQDIITNLLTFSRMKAEGEEEYTTEKISDLCNRIIELHAYKLRSFNVEVIKKFPKEEEAIPLKANKIQQVILNLVTNAIDAMKELEKRELTLTLNCSQASNSLSVSDTGSGMDEETLDKIFEPFFTTKQTGQGTGLGLSVTKSIVEEHSGTLTCESKLGQGTTFIITLPLKKSEEEN